MCCTDYSHHQNQPTVKGSGHRQLRPLVWVNESHFVVTVTVGLEQGLYYLLHDRETGVRFLQTEIFLYPPQSQCRLWGTYTLLSRLEVFPPEVKRGKASNSPSNADVKKCLQLYLHSPIRLHARYFTKHTDDIRHIHFSLHFIYVCLVTTAGRSVKRTDFCAWPVRVACFTTVSYMCSL